MFSILQFQRREVEVHLESGTRLHLDLACVKLNKTEDNLIKAREELRNTQEKLNETEDNLIKAREELRNTQEKFEETKRKHEEKIDSVENKLLHYLGEHTWKISGFNEKMRQAKPGKEIKIDSAPFYTDAFGRYGYKFKLLLTLDYKLGTIVCLKVYFVIMKGEYDSILPWPFRRKIIFTLVDQQEDLNDRENIVALLTSDPTKDEEWNKRPVTDENVGKRLICYLSQIEVLEGRFIVDDTIFVQVTVVP